ncbi:MlaD family protein [Thermodesulforhabdus norvegica]|uniref:Phospholipid/cholesterol/gamma-HCH transport system substrate-binding protein n=1 Tax=Thermodesulforhabdus norvegica TaxID=39841 RepID=A0A1I4RJ47_9BACT|nr:MlaD family protein [Thermodesulforhabdus norvegica]SFM52076.1 phospholipid/cholesterol/gamma-HCH transport system substrate-binding protein [Thermodesulforhabdus norvegica]
MSRRVKTVYVGVFTLICLSLIVGLFLWIGLSHFFEEYKTYATYFDESVKGLQKDAVINYRGVPVGRVGRIGIAPDGRLIEVLLHLKPDLVVDEDVVVRLREQGITGLRFLEIDRAPEDAEKLSPVITFSPPYPVIRSYPSEFALLKRSLETLYSRIESLNIEGLVSQWSALAKELRSAVSEEEFGEMIRSLRIFSENLSSISENLKVVANRERLEDYADEIEALLKESRLALTTTTQKARSLDVASLNQAIRETRDLVVNTQKTLEALQVMLTSVLEDLRMSVEQLSLTVEDLRAEPSRILLVPRKSDPFESTNKGHKK